MQVEPTEYGFANPPSVQGQRQEENTGIHNIQPWKNLVAHFWDALEEKHPLRQ